MSSDINEKESRVKNLGNSSFREQRELSRESVGSKGKYKNVRNFSQIELSGEFLTI